MTPYNGCRRDTPILPDAEFQFNVSADLSGIYTVREDRRGSRGGVIAPPCVCAAALVPERITAAI